MTCRVAHAVFLPVVALALPLMKGFGEDGGPNDGGSEMRSQNFTNQIDAISDLLKDVPLESRNEGDESGVSVECRGRLVKAPRNGFLLKSGGKSVFLCSSAKVASSTIVVFMQSLISGQHHSSPSHARTWGQQYELRTLEKKGRIQELCDVDFSLAMVRNPYDRLKSGFLDKVNRVTRVPGAPHATFADFLDALKVIPPENMNAHWKPITSHCNIGGSDGYPYTKFYKIEDSLEEGLVDAFTNLGYSKPTIKKVLKEIGDVNANVEDSHNLEARREFYAAQRQDSQARVKRMYAEDLKVGNYRFDAYP